MPQGYFMRTPGLTILGFISVMMAAAIFSMVYVASFATLAQTLPAAVFSIALFIAIWAIIYGVLILAGAAHDVHTARSITNRRLATQLAETALPARPRRIARAPKKAARKSKPKRSRSRARKR